jgi:hypothetical protein
MLAKGGTVAGIKCHVPLAVFVSKPNHCQIALSDADGIDAGRLMVTPVCVDFT